MFCMTLLKESFLWNLISKGFFTFDAYIHKIPEQEPAWEILMDLKEIVDIIVTNRVSEEALCYLTCELLDHRKLLTSTFPEFRLRPKH